MSDNSAKALKSGAWYTISNFLVRGMGFITTPIFTRLLSKPEFGMYNNYTSWLGILTIVITLNLESTFISARYDYEDNFDEYIMSMLSLSMFSALAWMLVLNVFGTFAESRLLLSRTYINCMMMYLLFLPAINMFQARERYFFRYKTSVLVSLFVSVGGALLSVLLVTVMSNKLTGRIVGSIIPTVALGILIVLFFIMKVKKINVSYWKYALPICLPFIPHLLSLNILSSLDRIMILRLCSEADAALYSLANTCGSLVTLLVVSLNSAFAPWLGEQLKNGNHERIRNVSRIYILIFISIAAGIMIAAPELLYFLGGKPYTESKFVMPPVALGCICQFLYILYVNVEQFKKKTVGMAIASISAALLNYVLNAYFIPKYGYIAAAYTTFVGYLWLMISHMVLVKWLGYSDVFDNKMVIISLLISILITIGVNYLYTADILRYAVFALYALTVLFAVYMNRQKLMELIRNRRK